jgi:hypothetical protein
VSWCGGCHSSLELSATFHVDCLQLFMKTCAPQDAMERLWTAAVWRDPLSARMRIPLRFARGAASVSGEAFDTVAEMCGLSIKRLPREIRDMIPEYMYRHLLWRYMAVLDLAWRLSSGSASADPLRSVPLSTTSSLGNADWLFGCIQIRPRQMAMRIRTLSPSCAARSTQWAWPRSKGCPRGQP